MRLTCEMIGNYLFCEAKNVSLATQNSWTLPKQIQITVSPREAAVAELLEKAVARQAGCFVGDIAKMNILRRSIDARKRGQVKVNLTMELLLHGEEIVKSSYRFRFENVRSCPEVDRKSVV